MGALLGVFGFFVAVVVVLVVWGVKIYNSLVTLRERFRNAYAQIDVQLKRRYDLIPNLVEAAKGYLSHERETLEAVIEARASATKAEIKAAADPSAPGAMKDLGAAEAKLQTALGRLLVSVEQYPDLKADQTVAQLTEELTSTENRISFARQAFNDSVMFYNAERQKFPNFLIAGPAGFTPADQLEIEGEEFKEAPKISMT